MGQGIFIRNVYVSGVLKHNIDDNLDDLRNYMESIEREIAMLVAADPKSLHTKNEKGETIPWIETLPKRVKELLDMYKDYAAREYLLRIASIDMNDVTDDY